MKYNIYYENQSILSEETANGLGYYRPKIY